MSEEEPLKVRENAGLQYFMYLRICFVGEVFARVVLPPKMRLFSKSDAYLASPTAYGINYTAGIECRSGS